MARRDAGCGASNGRVQLEAYREESRMLCGTEIKNVYRTVLRTTQYLGMYRRGRKVRCVASDGRRKREKRKCSTNTRVLSVELKEIPLLK